MKPSRIIFYITFLFLPLLFIGCFPTYQAKMADPGSLEKGTYSDIQSPLAERHWIGSLKDIIKRQLKNIYKLYDAENKIDIDCIKL